ncbi:uncharacterized protein F5Z01DRAFT_303845 [Emericellopsis atlantica]|uniref:Uncharacterized protein n=1 Tax=Emericellopsis atlantica TaxID=2614577 RepID=A0A9P8CUU4_9HYPO|nr:uncharacterized protein F5Z01DRAFT_303845 [Emericellopsis atlantica]KAG9257821.1 hypothetical protein F5Z01DRAFT_303845 [Emericellopsis atlantica]
MKLSLQRRQAHVCLALPHVLVVGAFTTSRIGTASCILPASLPPFSASQPYEYDLRHLQARLQLAFSLRKIRSVSGFRSPAVTWAKPHPIAWLWLAASPDTFPSQLEPKEQILNAECTDTPTNMRTRANEMLAEPPSVPWPMQPFLLSGQVSCEEAQWESLRILDNHQLRTAR